MSSGTRLRSGLRRHGLTPRPAAIRALVGDQELRFSEGNDVRIYGDGRPALRDMLDAIAGAERRVHLETYILRTDATGRRFLEALTERCRAGVAVRLLFDAFGSRGLDESRLRPLRDAGADVVAFNPLRRFYPRWAPRRRDHRKILCVDGAVAFAGGLNIGNEYWGDGEDQAGWRDTHLRLEGPVVRDLEVVFLESWFRADGPELPWSAIAADRPPSAGSVRCAVVPDGPVYRRRRMRDLLIAGLAATRRGVRLESPYFAPGRRVLRALSETGERASVDLVLAGHTDHPLLRRAAHALAPRLLASGVRVHEYYGRVMHAKVAIFDEEWVVVGSSNIDRQSLEHSYEVNLVLEGDEVAERLSEMFERDLERCRPVDQPALDARGLVERLLDGLSALLLRIV